MSAKDKIDLSRIIYSEGWGYGELLQNLIMQLTGVPVAESNALWYSFINNYPEYYFLNDYAAERAQGFQASDGSVPPYQAADYQPYCNRTDVNVAEVAIDNIARPSAYFVGRSQEMSDITEQLQHHGVVCLAGLGGVGKTQTARYYSYQQRTRYQVVWWCAAEHEATLVADLRALAGHLIAAGLIPAWDSTGFSQADFIRGFKARFSQIGRWLLICDNVEAFELIQDCVPAPTGQQRLLLTSRDSHGQDLKDALDGVVVPINPFGETDALLLLQKYLKPAQPSTSTPANPVWAPEERIAALELIGLLERLPLALNQAGAFMQQLRLSVVRVLEAL